MSITETLTRPAPAQWEAISGRGGKGGDKQFREDPNSLRSRGIARILDLIGEGEIRGLVNGSKSIFLDDTPIENENGELNFQGVSWAAVYGLPDQPHIPGFTSVEAPLEGFAGIRVRAGLPLTRRINDLDADAVRLTLQVPALNETDEKAARLKGTTVQVRISVASRANGPAPIFKQAVLATISGKTTSPYEEDYRIELPGEGPWDIRVERLTPDSENVKLVNETVWARNSLIYDHKFSYPFSALIGLEVNSEYFGTTIPRRAYEVYGLIIKAPSNYDPISRTYTGLWDGTFKMAWTNNPAWVFYDLLTNDRYGLGLKPAHVDKWSLYSIAQYCDEMVGDGYGGTEPRFTFNGVISKQEEAHKVLQALASSFRGMLYWSTGMVTATQDRPEDPVKIFTPANVLGGDFEYSGTAKNARHTVAIVAWNNPATNYEIDYEVVEDAKAILRYGMRPMDMTAYGCTSRGQARREGRWVIATEKLETDGVKFRTGFEGADLVPGNIIGVADPAYAGVRMGGRVLDVADNHVRMDAAFLFKAGETYEVSVMSEGGKIVTRGVGNAPGLSEVVQLVAPMPEAGEDGARPVVGSIFTLSEIGNVEPRPFRVISITEADKHQFEVFALEHRVEKYGIADRDDPFDTVGRNQFQDLPKANFCLPPSNLTATLVQRQRQFGLKPVLLVDWEPSPDLLVKGYIVTYRFDDENWVTLPMDSNTSVEIDDPDMTSYEIRVMAVNTFGHPSSMIRLRKNLNEFGDSTDQGLVYDLRSANGTTQFVTADAQIMWSARPVSDPESDGDFRDAFFMGFEVSIFVRPEGVDNTWSPPRDDAGNITLAPKRVEVVKDPAYLYSAEKNQEDGAGRRFWVEVRLLSSGGIVEVDGVPVEGTKSKPATARFFNPPPALQPAEIVLHPFHVQLLVNPPVDLDYAGVAVWTSEEPGVDPDTANLKWKTAGNPLISVIPAKKEAVADPTLPAQPNQKFYLRYALFDAYGMDELNISEEVEILVPEYEVTQIDGRPVGDLSDLLDNLEGVRDEVDDFRDEANKLRDELSKYGKAQLDLAWTQMGQSLTLVREAAEKDRLTYLEGQPIGPVLRKEIIRTDDAVQSLDLLGFKTANGGAFRLNLDTIRVTASQTMAERFNVIQTQHGQALSRIEGTERAISTERDTRTEQINQATSVWGENLSQATESLTTYADGIKTLVERDYTQKAVFGAYISLAGQNFTTLSEENEARAKFQQILGVMNPQGTAITLNIDNVKITDTESLAQRQALVEARFNGTSSSALLTKVEASASDAGAALTALEQMGVDYKNASAWQINSGRVLAGPGELLSTRLQSIGVQLANRPEGGVVDARIDNKITASITAGGPIANWMQGTFTRVDDLESGAGVLTESINGVKARASLFVTGGKKIGGLNVGINQELIDMEFVSNRFFFVDEAGGNRVQVLSYVNGQWMFSSSVAIRGDLLVTGTITNDKLQDDAITRVDVGYNPGTITLNNSTPTRVHGVWIPVAKADSPIDIDFNSWATFTHNSAGSFVATVQLVRSRSETGGEVIQSFNLNGSGMANDTWQGAIPVKFLDRPGAAGNWHYYVQIFFNVGNMSVQTVTARYGKVSEMKNNTTVLGSGTGSGTGVGGGGGTGGGGGFEPPPGGGGGGDMEIVT